MRQILRVLSKALVVLLVFVLVFNLALIFSRFVLKQTPPRVFGLTPLSVVSGSMEPEIHVGDMVVVRAADSYAVGDVITFDGGGFYVTHELIEMNGDRFTTKGTNNNAADEPISKDIVVGKVVTVIPRVGMILEFLRTPVGLILVAALVFGVTKLSDALRVSRPKEAEEIKK